MAGTGKRSVRKKHEAETTILRLGAAAEFLDISQNSLRLLVAKGEVPHRRAGRKLFLFDKEQLTKWVRRGAR